MQSAITLPTTFQPNTPITIEIPLLGSNHLSQHELAVRRAMEQIGQRRDVSTVRSVTVAVDYPGAVARSGLVDSVEGIQKSKALAVFRDALGEPETHIFADLKYVAGIFEEGSSGYNDALQILGHEGCHAQTFAQQQRAFPHGLPDCSDDPLRSWSCHYSRPCWDEYQTCYLSHSIGTDPLPFFRDVLDSHLLRIEAELKILREAVQDKELAGLLFPQMYRIYGGTMVAMSCVLGVLAARALKWPKVQKVSPILVGHRLSRYAKPLAWNLRRIQDSYSLEPDAKAYEALPLLLQQMVMGLEGEWIQRTLVPRAA